MSKIDAKMTKPALTEKQQAYEDDYQRMIEEISRVLINRGYKPVDIEMHDLQHKYNDLME